MKKIRKSKTMKKPLMKLLLLNLLVYGILLTIFYFSAFLSGYGSNNSLLVQEEHLFIKFVVIHLLVNCFLLYKFKQVNLIGIVNSIFLILILYVLTAWKAEYL